MPDALTLEAHRILPGPSRLGGLTLAEWPSQALVSVAGDVTAHDRPDWRDGWIATGPGRWLVARRTDPATLLADLGAQLPAATLVDVSDAYACFTLSGRPARDVLAKGVTLDLDAFGPGAAAVTAIAHTGVILWCEDDPDTFELAVTRSYTGSFLHWLEVSAPAGSAPS